MSGIVGSRLNTRGSGLVGSLGTDGQVFTSSGAGAGAVYEDAAEFDDTDLRSDIMTLALKEAITENRIAYNLPNAMIEQFQDDSKIGTETTGDRNSSEYWETLINGGIDSNTVFIIHSDTSDGSTTFTDSSSNNLTMTAVGDTQHDTAQYKFGSTSIKFDGTADYLRTPDLGSGLTNATATTGNFTVDYWMRPDGNTGMNGERHFSIGATADPPSYSTCPRFTFGLNYNANATGSGNFYGREAAGCVDVSVTAAHTYENWNHFALMRSGANIYYIFNGVQKFSSSTWSGLDMDYSNGKFMIGATPHSANEHSNGWFDEFRYSNNAQYTPGSNGDTLFTVETSAYTGNVTNATGTLISTAQTANASQTKVSGVIIYKNEEGTATLGTDLKIYFTCNGGTNWTESTPTAAGTFSSGILMAKCPEVTCTAGTDIRYKAVWANQSSGSKETQLHGIGMNY